MLSQWERREEEEHMKGRRVPQNSCSSSCRLQRRSSEISTPTRRGEHTRRFSDAGPLRGGRDADLALGEEECCTIGTRLLNKYEVQLEVNYRNNCDEFNSSNPTHPIRITEEVDY
ncbi:hypothetical protein EYF80_020256 [Liparis tanakae]|uniref:Uncharacterized protein n=1 Tax=Liparis tanakae TaxID=230148 RepID=A0A4Z2HVJ9_9TELE|nr:hypothetical protein EYF80_020256 [Liparis tanakae]